MTALHPDLGRYRSELRDAIERDLDRRRARRRTRLRALRYGTPALVVTLGACVVLVLSAGPGARSGDAAVLNAVESVLSPPAGTILHDAATVSMNGQAAQPYELWADADSPNAYRVIKAGHEAAWNGTTLSNYDQTSNTITDGGAFAPNHIPADLAGTLRSLIQSGHARVTGTTVVDGVAAYALTVSNLPSGWVSGVANGTYDVAQSDYRPLLIETTVSCGPGTCTETIRFQTYEYLPATPANLSLLDLHAQHPDATVVPRPAASTDTKTQ